MGLYDVVLSVLEDGAAAQLAVRVACTSTVPAPRTHRNDAQHRLKLSRNCWEDKRVMAASADAKPDSREHHRSVVNHVYIVN